MPIQRHRKKNPAGYFMRIFTRIIISRAKRWEAEGLIMAPEQVDEPNLVNKK